MTFADYIAANPVFTTQEMLLATDTFPGAHVALSRAVKSGKVLKVRSGLYISQSGKYEDAKADPFMIAQTLRPDAVFVYHSALELHGLAHSLMYTVHFMTKGTPIKFNYDSIEYRSFPLRNRAQTETLSAKAFGTVTVTVREQTLVDCMARIGMAGGTEEVLRGFAGLPYVDLDTVLVSLALYPPSVAARIGWYLEANQSRWSVPDVILSTIESTIPKKASYKLDPASSRSESYSSRWHLSLPATADASRTWMEM